MKGLGAGIAITGSGAATPSQVLTNDHLSQMVDTSDEWIQSRTGIRQRHLAAAGESLSELSAQAAAAALSMAGIAPDF